MKVNAEDEEHVPGTLTFLVMQQQRMTDTMV